jgi:hypothetical protein
MRHPQEKATGTHRIGDLIGFRTDPDIIDKRTVSAFISPRRPY